MPKQKIILYWSDEDQAYLADVPDSGMCGRWSDLPGGVGQRGPRDHRVDGKRRRSWAARFPNRAVASSSHRGVRASAVGRLSNLAVPTMCASPPQSAVITATIRITSAMTM